MNNSRLPSHITTVILEKNSLNKHMRFVIKNILKVALLSYFPLSLLITDEKYSPKHYKYVYPCLMHNQNNIHNTVH